ncbi:MAG: SOS response-associated peptidase [Saprospirales bacterium]|nr:SOS response-associated peptidase [Saprospirales bacterium]
MCGRFSLAVSESKIQEELPFVDPGSNLRISYNIAPTQHAYVVTNDQQEHLQYITWGLVPYWAEEGKNNGKLINARSEGIESKPSFRVPIRKRRCLVLADSFYEWRMINHKKIPYRIVPRDGSLLVMAGIWDIWEKDGYPIKSFSIITTTPNQEVSSLHDRMPVILPTNKERKKWLEHLELEEVLEFLHPPKDGMFKVYRVSDELNSPNNNIPELHKEIQENLDLFSQR